MQGRHLTFTVGYSKIKERSKNRKFTLKFDHVQQLSPKVFKLSFKYLNIYSPKVAIFAEK